MKTGDDEKKVDKQFEYRSYGKGELALLYSPFVLQKTAVTKLNEWVARVPGLADKLAATGLAPCAKRYTPAQVRLVVEALGEP